MVIFLELENLDYTYVAYVPDNLRALMDSNVTSVPTLLWNLTRWKFVNYSKTTILMDLAISYFPDVPSDSLHFGIQCEVMLQYLPNIRL
jgi:hypothetical protein